MLGSSVSTLTWPGPSHSTLATVALLVGFGAMIGRMLEVSGGAQVLADRLVDAFGAERAPLALGIASLLFGFPIFFDAGLVVMLPIIFSVAHRFGGSVLTYALPAAGAFAVMHAFLPPHPGPVAAGDLLDGHERDPAHVLALDRDHGLGDAMNDLFSLRGSEDSLDDLDADEWHVDRDLSRTGCQAIR